MNTSLHFTSSYLDPCPHTLYYARLHNLFFGQPEIEVVDAKKAWIDIALQDHRLIPEPADATDYSGKFVVRMPKSFHKALVEQSEKEGVSLNQYVLFQLAKTRLTTETIQTA